jgi:hypothetical protein
MVGLALVGVCGSIGYFNRVSLVLIFLAVYPLVFYLTHVSLYRYRFPIEPFLLILAARGLYGLWYRVIRRGRRGDGLDNAGLGAVTKHQAGAPVGA